MVDMMFRFVAAALTVFGLATTALAQDATTTLPQAYKTVLENDYVKVVRVRYEAGVTLPAHAHALTNTTYVYLNDSEGVIFRHIGGRGHTVTRQPVKAGAVRVSGGGDESHEVENTSKTASDFLRVVLKTPSAGGRAGGRLAPTDPTFANGQIRITRLKVEQHESAEIKGDTPSLVIEVPSGTPRWVDAGKSATIENHDAPDLNLVRIELLTKPK